MDAGDTTTPIIGVDATKGGGASALYLPLEGPQELVLIVAGDNYVGGEGPKSAYFDIWGFDPRLVVAVSFQRSRNANVADGMNTSNITAQVDAHVLVKTAGGVVTGAALPVADLFVNGGALDIGTEADGCEIVSAVQGIRFNLGAQRTGATNVDVTVTVQVRPNVALICRALAQSLLLGVTVSPQRVGVSWP